MPGLALDDLITAHRLATEAFRHAVRDSPNSIEEDHAYEREAIALLALLSFEPATIEDARQRAGYLFATRFFDGLDEDGRIYFCSLLPPTWSPA